MGWRADCCCGWSAKSHSWSAIENVKAWHEENGCEGADHVVALEYIDNGLTRRRK